MKTNEVTKKENGITSIQLINHKPTDTSPIIMNLIYEKKNFNKTQKLQIWLVNHNCKIDVTDNRIRELKFKKVNDKAIKLHSKINSFIKISNLNSVVA